MDATLPKREIDDFGSGEFGAPRGKNKHKGIDYACYPGSEIRSTINGEVTKLGYAYNDDLSFRYVEITDGNLLRHRYFYLEPLVKKGQSIVHGQIIGTAQNIAARYTDSKRVMLNHCHFEVLQIDNTPINPEIFDGYS